MEDKRFIKPSITLQYAELMMEYACFMEVLCRFCAEEY